MASSNQVVSISCPDAAKKLTLHGVSCELRTLAASQVGALLAFMVALALFVGEAWIRSTNSHRQFFDVFAFLFFLTTLYFFVMEWTLEEDRIYELRNLSTPPIWAKLISSIQSILIKPLAYILLLLLFVAVGLTSRYLPTFHKWNSVALVSGVALFIAPLFLAFIHTFPRLEYFIRVLVILTLIASIGVPPEWIPIFHNPIDWGFVEMGLVYFFFLLWDAVVVLGHSSSETQKSYFAIFLIDSIAGSFLLLAIWGHTIENIHVAQFSCLSLTVVLVIAALYPTPKTVHLLSRIFHREKLR